MKKIIYMVAVVFLMLVSTSSVTTLSSQNLIEQEDSILTALDDSILTLTYKDQQKTYTLADLQDFECFLGSGGRIKKTGSISGPFDYKGVKISKLAEEFSLLPSAYGLVTIADDGYTSSFTYGETQGNIMVYDTEGNELGIGGVTMILAYEEEGQTDFSGGPLRVAWVDDGSITSSNLWSKSIVEIEFLDVVPEDSQEPKLTITQPNNGIYLFNSKLLTFPFNLIIGKITIKVDATDDETEVTKVIILINEELKKTISDPPYEWTWDEKVTGPQTIEVKAYDAAGNIATAQEDVIIFNLL